MELGITGGEEDGVNNEDPNPEDLYSKPEDHLRDGEGRFRRHAETCFMFGMFKGCYI
jgi:fructose/tagatose bisphosphate aldolase